MKIFFTFCFFCLGIFNSYSQGYESLFGTTSAAWKIVDMNLWGPWADSLNTDNDTIINSVKYKKIYTDYPSYNIDGFLREDTLTGRAWYRGWYSPSPPPFGTGDSTERLIMNMSLAVGDSFYFPTTIHWPLDTGWVKVDSVYSVSGKKYVRFTDTTYWGDKALFIEGIGTNMGITYLSNPMNVAPYLLCAYKNSQIVYSNTNPYFNGCDLNPTSINQIWDANKMISIFPHPITSISTFQFHNLTGALFTLNIYDIFGKKVKQYATTADKINIENHNIADGIYYYQLSSSFAHIPEASGEIIFINQK